MRERVDRLAGAYVTWELHIGGHFCPTSEGTGACKVGDELLRRLHTAYAHLEDDDRQHVLWAVRAWDWEDDPLYPRDSG
jgi:hypothetical protein